MISFIHSFVLLVSCVSSSFLSSLSSVFFVGFIHVAQLCDAHNTTTFVCVSVFFFILFSSSCSVGYIIYTKLAWSARLFCRVCCVFGIYIYIFVQNYSHLTTVLFLLIKQQIDNQKQNRMLKAQRNEKKRERERQKKEREEKQNESIHFLIIYTYTHTSSENSHLVNWVFVLEKQPLSDRALDPVVVLYCFPKMAHHDNNNNMHSKNNPYKKIQRIELLLKKEDFESFSRTREEKEEKRPHKKWLLIYTFFCIEAYLFRGRVMTDMRHKWFKHFILFPADLINEVKIN